jgi:hypothetical protein
VLLLFDGRIVVDLDQVTIRVLKIDLLYTIRANGRLFAVPGQFGILYLNVYSGLR